MFEFLTLYMFKQFLNINVSGTSSDLKFQKFRETKNEFSQNVPGGRKKEWQIQDGDPGMTLQPVHIGYCGICQ